jgi:hypothetical protein
MGVHRRTITLRKDGFTTGLQLMLPSSMSGSHDSVSGGFFLSFFSPFDSFYHTPLAMEFHCR